jgi:hypothetical protein
MKPGSIQKGFRLFFAGFLLTLLPSKLHFFSFLPFVFCHLTYGFRVLGSDLRFLTSDFCPLSSEIWVQGSRFWIQRFWFLSSDF